MACKTYIIYYPALYRKCLLLLYLIVTRDGGGRLEDLRKIPWPAPTPTQVILTCRMG